MNSCLDVCTFQWENILENFFSCHEMLVFTTSDMQHRICTYKSIFIQVTSSRFQQMLYKKQILKLLSLNKN